MADPVGHYSPFVEAGGWWVCSGQIGVTQGPNGAVLATGFDAQVLQAFANVEELLEQAGLGWRDVVKVTAFLTDLSHYSTFNRLYMAELGDHRPARSVVVVAALPLHAQVEIEVWAHRPDSFGA